MSASGVRICLRLFALFCISIFTPLCAQEKSSVIWRNRGDSVTIHCEPSSDDKKYIETINVKRGIKKDTDFFFKSNKYTNANFAEHAKLRAQFNDKFPNIDILLTNLTTNDSEVYWCMYQKYDPTALSTEIIEGKGSMLLVVTDPVAVTDKSTSQECEQPSKNLVVISVAISATVLLAIMMALLFLVIRKVKSFHSQDKRPIPNNDVYEDMRGTIRR